MADQNLLSKNPVELGIAFGEEDNLNVKIVAVRAGCPLKPGQRCSFNEYQEVVGNVKGPGIADPFHNGVIRRGKSFWMLLCPNDQVEMPIDFSPPKREPKYSGYLLRYATLFDVTYDQLMDAAEYVVKKKVSAPYPGKKSVEELEDANDAFLDEHYEMWSEWADEMLHEFPNYGSKCCPEYQYPKQRLFTL